MISRHTAPPEAAVILGMFSTQAGAALAKHLFDQAPVLAVGMLRLGFAALVLLALVRPRVRGLTGRDVSLILAFGLSLAVMNLAFYEALSRIPLGVAVTVEFLGPLGVAAALSRHRLDALWIALAAFGVVLLARGGGPINTTGIALALLAGAGWAAYIVLNTLAGRRFPGTSGLALAMPVGALVSLPFGLTPPPGALGHPGVLAAGFGVALASSVVPYSLEMMALRRIAGRVFGVLMSLEPAVAALVGLVALGEALGGREWLGLVLVVAASAGIRRGSPPRMSPPQAG